MIKYQAKLIDLNADIEELAVFSINNIKLICFVSYSESPLELGKEYSVELNYQIFNNYQIRLATEREKVGFLNIKNTLNYYLTGIFQGDIFYIESLKFIDEYLLTEFTYLENKKITLFIDRLDIAIYEQIN